MGAVMSRLSRVQILAVLLAAPLLIVWSIPHSVALRNLMLGLLCLTVCLAPEGRNAMRRGLFGCWEGRIYLVLSAWLLLQALLWAWFPAETWSELSGQWFKGSAILLTGMGFAALLAQGQGNARRALLVVYCALGIAVLAQLVDYLWAWAALGRMPMNSDGIFRGKVQVSYLGNLFFAMTMAEVFARMSKARSALALRLPWLMAGACAAILVVVLSGARNGMVGLVLLFGSTALLAWWFAPHEIARKGRWRWPLLAGVCIVLLTGAGWKFDPRWKLFDDTLPYALDTDTYKTWLNAKRYPYPRLPNGQEVDASAYERVAFIAVGMKLSSQLPLGIGYTRQAFSHAVKAQYGERTKHAHSGFIEYLIAMGWPGIIAWFAFLGLALKRAIGLFLHRYSSVGLMAAFLITGFAGRMMIENITRDHMLEMFLFLLGLLLSALHYEQQNGAESDKTNALPLER